ncbi:helicase HerA domain-containing protein [Pseudonocardia kunmingensis]|uniref:Uncharacterized protein DUF87 n=1 Tax=Pseudonocardia kunmingensis TaxID=630975 RepID=A0A543D9I0_9PSEU|nr:DUF87 domain-containing protein [Pseudonocardia kunmingensis]TQM05993.1 uncharacterized protein DUF87 [Pseudonocardia kunmingensis]
MSGPPPPPAPPPIAPPFTGGPIGDYLRDPLGTVQDLFDTVAGWASVWGPLLVPALALVGAAAPAGHRRWMRRRHDRLVGDARQITMLAPPDVDPAGGEALWSNLVGLLRPAWRRTVSGQPHLGCEYLFSDTGVTIRLWVPGSVPPGMVERAIEAAWPGAHTHTGPAESPLPTPRPGRRRVMTGAELRLARPEALPIRTDFDADPIRALIGAATGLRPHEHACVQVLARPVTGARVARARLAARRLHSGTSPSVVGRLLDLLTPGMPTGPRASGSRTPGAAGRNPQTSLEHSALNRAVIGKEHGSQYETVVRYAVALELHADADEHSRRAALDVARGRAHALAASFASYTEHNRYTRIRIRRHVDAVLTGRRLRRGDLLSIPELAAIAHLPTDDSVPGLHRAGARAVAPPPGIAAPGPDSKPLGNSDTNHERPIALRVPDARHHLHVIGATGSGKSTLLATMILADIDTGRGVVLIDPKGDLVTDILSRMPAAAADRVVLFDADSKTVPPCLNPLHGGETDLTVDNVVSVFRRVYSAFWGPRTDDVMRAACLTLRTQHGVTTLADLPRLLTDPAYRDRVTAAVTDPVLRGFWDWYDTLTDASRSQVISPLMNKLRAFLLRPFVRDALAAGPSTVDMNEILDGGICLVRIPKGSLGEETTRLIGSLTVAAAWQATTARAATPQRLRRDAALVIDEAHNFLNLPYPIEDMLAEARGFRVALTLAHQHLGQLPRELREGLSTNARSKIFFNSGPEDARELSRHTAPRLGEHDLAHLGAFHAAARLVLHGEQTEAFTLRTNPLPPPTPGRSREIRAAAASRQHRARNNQPGGRPTADPTQVRDVPASPPGPSRRRPDDRPAADRPPAPVIHGDPRRR